ncbi:DsbA family protein [Streptomyces sp. TG1A-8]|uniref:DsbA family oxidoreductase n=1 Tax=Streptomyces sp. TG1A-8 TaxID=3051385 RepID=UPI00265BD859|nr:DsbA family protein [Streptomyces sp. TG1A-8]MDO0929538.1 DsbA family protein [Streptomyces sp. TG1A-8]
MTVAADGVSVEVVEYTDPLCPWSWGAEPVLRGLRAALSGRVRWRRVYCVLFDEDDDPAPDPAAETAWYSRYVKDISGHTHAPRAGRLSRVAASSWPSSLVAKAAELQGREVAERVLRRLRETVFVLGEPADTPALALSAAWGLPGLDLERLAADAASAAVRDRVRADRAEARRPVREVLSAPGGSPHPGAAKETADGGYRYALPTLLVHSSAGVRAVPGWRSYEDYTSALEASGPGLLSAPVTLDPATALERYRSLTDPERTLLTHGAWPPVAAVRVETGNGPLWLHPEEAATHPVTGRGTPTGP